MQRVLEIQANWDEREKLRHYAVSRPPMMPQMPQVMPQMPQMMPQMPQMQSMPMIQPGYRPDQVSVYRIPSQDLNRIDFNEMSNSGNSPYSFLQNKEIKNDKIERKLITENSIEKEIKATQNQIKNENINNIIALEKTSKKQNKQATMKISKIDYEMKLNEINEGLKKINIYVDSIKLKKMISGKSDKEIDSLVNLIKKHPEVFSANKILNISQDIPFSLQSKFRETSFPSKNINSQFKTKNKLILSNGPIRINSFE